MKWIQQCYIYLVILGMGLSSLKAQNKLNNELNDLKKQSINLEVAGRGFVFGSLSYEYLLKPQFALGLGLGVANISSGEISRFNNGISETGEYLDAAISQQLYFNYFLGKRKHKLLLTGGISHLLGASRNKYPTETERYAESSWLPNIGLGYQLTGNKIQARFVAYGIKFPKPTGWFPEYMPWGGISIGYRF